MRRLHALILLLAAGLSMQAHAIDFIATNIYTVAKETVVENEQWVLTDLAEIEGRFKNDLFIAAGSMLQLNGAFEGNLWSVGSMETTFTGTCLRNVRLTGKTVRVSGTINGNLIVLADTILISTNAVVGGSAHLLGSSIIQEGLIEGDVRLSAARIVSMDGTIEGNARITSPDILLGRNTRIGGDLIYTANKELFPSGNIISGTLKRTEPETRITSARITSRAFWLFAAFLAGIPFMALFPMTTAMAAQLVRTSPWKCLLAGFLASGALPVLGIMSVSSLIGVPLGTLILAAWGALFYLSRIIMGLVLGSLILRSAGTSLFRILMSMALGLAIIYSATIIPSIGIPVQVSVLWMGMGSLILALLEKRRMIIQLPKNLKQFEALKNGNNTNREDTP
ncbi:MAG TPA: hypothetical protein VIR77_03700 [Pontiella sp.]